MYDVYIDFGSWVVNTQTGESNHHIKKKIKAVFMSKCEDAHQSKNGSERSWSLEASPNFKNVFQKQNVFMFVQQAVFTACLQEKCVQSSSNSEKNLRQQDSANHSNLGLWLNIQEQQPR